MRAASGTGGKQEIPTLEEHALYHNLCILGIVSPNLRHEGIELGRTTFRRSNNKALEYVLYRLYSIIEGKSRAQKDFKGMLPVLDKVQQAPFYQRIGDWMMELKKSGRIEPSVILPVSALKTNTSSRLVLLLLELSTVALYHDLEASCPGSAYLPTLSLSSSTAAGPVGSGVGLLEDQVLPPELRLGLSITRAKQACGEFLSSAASASAVCDALEQYSLSFKKRYYELQAERRYQDGVLTDAAVAATGGATPQSAPGSPTTIPGDASATRPAAAAGAGSTSLWRAASNTAAASGGGQLQPQPQPLSRDGRPAAESLATLSALLAGLDEHLRVHVDLSKALMTDGSAAAAAAAGGPMGRSDSGEGGGNAAGALGGGGGGSGGTNGLGSFGQALPSRQVLHPHQIDGQALAAAASAAAAAAVAEPPGRGGGGGMYDQAAAARRQLKNMPVPFGPENIVGAVMSFSSLLSSLAPHITQLAMAGENAGPPPLLQPPSQPSSHAAHVAHQLQVHERAHREVNQLSRKLHEQSVAFDAVLRSLRAEEGMSRSRGGGGGAFGDEDFLDLGPHLGLPAAITAPTQALDTPMPSRSPRPNSATQANMLAAASEGFRASGVPPALATAASPAPQPPSRAGAAAAVMGVASPLTAKAGAAAAAAAHPAVDGAMMKGGDPGGDVARLQARIRCFGLGDANAAANAASSASVPSRSVAAVGGGGAPTGQPQPQPVAGTITLASAQSQPQAASADVRGTAGPNAAASSTSMASASAAVLQQAPYDAFLSSLRVATSMDPILRGGRAATADARSGWPEAGVAIAGGAETAFQQHSHQHQHQPLSANSHQGGAPAAASTFEDGGRPPAGLWSTPTPFGCGATPIKAAHSSNAQSRGMGMGMPGASPREGRSGVEPSSGNTATATSQGWLLQQMQQHTTVSPATTRLTLDGQYPRLQSSPRMLAQDPPAVTSAADVPPRHQGHQSILQQQPAHGLPAPANGAFNRSAALGGMSGPASQQHAMPYAAPFGMAPVHPLRDNEMPFAAGASFAAAAGSSGTAAAAAPAGPGSAARMDLCSLLDDDEDHHQHPHQHHRPGSSHAVGGGGGLTPTAGAAAARAAAPGRGAAQDATGCFTGVAASAPTADAEADADFGLLAAEGELVSQALIHGGGGSTPCSPLTAMTLTPSGGGPVAPTTATTVASATASTSALGGAMAALAACTLGDPGSAWGSYCGGVTDSVDTDVAADPASVGMGATAGSRARIGLGIGAGARGSACSGGSAQGHGVADREGGDDVLMADTDTDTDPTPGRGAGPGPGAGGGWMGVAGGGHYKGASSGFDPMGAVLSPFPGGTLHKPRSDDMLISPAPLAAVPPNMGGLGADILALKARMQAISRQSAWGN